MKLSIIIPVYHTQDTLPKCLDSILRQSFTDYEVILVDDGSPDNSASICDEYAQKDNRIKVIHKKNGGLSDARNAGIEVSKGEYITFIDSDDTIQSNTLKPLMDELVQYPDVDILEYPVLERYGHPRNQHLLSFQPFEYDNCMDYWFYEKAYNHTYAWNKIYKRHLFEHIRFPKGQTFEEVLTIPLLIGLIPQQGHKKSIRIRVTNAGCYIYHWNEKGITANAKYNDLYNLYQGHYKSFRYILQNLDGNIGLIRKYQCPLQAYMTQILNVLLDLYGLSGKYEDYPPFIHDVGKLSKVMKIKQIKLKLLLFLGYHNLCKLNKLIHYIYKITYYES